MKIITVIVTVLAIVASGLGSTAAAENPATRATVITGLASMPLAFTENQGQWDEQVLFRANASGATMWFTKSGAYYQFTRRIANDGENPPQGVGHPGIGNSWGTPPLAVGSDHFDYQPDSIETMMIKANFVGANPNPHMVGEEMMEYKCNYFLGNDPTKWRTNVPNYQAIVYQEVYPGIDLKYYGNGKQMEYDFIVSPGADFAQIRIQYEGAKSLSIDTASRLVVETDWGEVVEQRPVVYQMSGGDRVSIVGEYVLKGDRAFGFELPDGYDANLPLVIDPMLVYSTYLGGYSTDFGWGIAVDASGSAYVMGYTYSADFPTENPYQTIQGGSDVFVTKLSNDGNSLVYSTYLGGSGNDNCECGSIAVDASGAAYVTGYTYSVDFPTENPFQTDQDTIDVFVTKLGSAGNSLVYSTYLGGYDCDWGYGITVDASGSAYVTGCTNSTDFPTENPYQTDQGGKDVFVTKLSSTGNSLVYSTYLGGNNTEEGRGIATDSSGAAYVTGNTYSSNFPTLNPYQTDQGSCDVFVTKLSSTGSSLVYSTYLGGNDWEHTYSIAVDASGKVYVAGETWSTDFPTENPFQTDQGGQDVFATKLGSSGDALVYSTYLGGSDNDYNGIIAVDTSGAAYMTGFTQSTDFPTEKPYQTYQGGSDVFVSKLSSPGSSLVYSTYLGGSEWDYGWGIAVDASRAAYVSGYTWSTNFPTENPFQTDQVGQDVFVTKLSETCCNGDGIRGDADNSGGAPNIGDVSHLVSFLFDQPPGPAPPCFEEGDVDASDAINVGDLSHLVSYLFDQPPGPAPLPCP